MKLFLSFLLTFSCCVFFTAEASAQTAVANQSNTTTITVKVTGVGCSTDIRTIGANVEKMTGVSSCEVAKRGAVTRFAVSYNPDVVCADDIYQAIQDTPGCKNSNDRPYRVKI